MREALVLAGRVQDLPAGQGIFVGREGREVALFNVDGKYLAVDNRCLHDGGPISQGTVVNCIVTCPRHHWHYDLRTGEAIGRSGRRLRCYPVEVQGDEVYVRLPRRRVWTTIRNLLRELAYVGDGYSGGLARESMMRKNWQPRRPGLRKP